MKKFLDRILVILMVMITLFEVAVPPITSYKSTYNTVYAAEKKTASEVVVDALLFGLNLVVTRIPGNERLLQLVRDTFDGTKAGDVINALTLVNYEPTRTCWYTAFATKDAISNGVDEIINEAYNKFTDETGLRSTLYIYYLDKDGNKNYPSKRRKLNLTISGAFSNQFSEQVYLVKGTVYKVPRYLMLEEVKEGFLEDIEAMVSNLLYSLANGLHFLISTALGKTITIDDLVFNKYAETNISYFDSKTEVGADMASSLIYGNNNVGGLNDVVNKWYGIFQKIALMGYMAILVYMGIRIILGATAEKKANYKELFMNWVVGIGILLLFPYAMKYIIKINEAMVKTIDANKGFTSIVAAPLIDDSNIYDKTSIDDEIDWSNGDDYMSQLGFAAYQTEKITLAFAFLIATWQLLVLIFHYYKRLFVIAYLIVIFPLVALSYAVDKIADGKSQALNTWIKEYMINVFVQTFHAIVYVFVCTTVYASAGMLGTNGPRTGNQIVAASASGASGMDYDFILVIVGITFLFKGEEIIRKIFGQESKAGTMKSLAGSAASTYAKIKAVETGAQLLGKHTFGEKAMPRKFARGIGNIAGIMKKRAHFDERAQKTEAPNAGARLPNAPTPPPSDASPNELQSYRKKMEAFNAVATMNNPKTHSLEELAAAEALLKKLAVEDPENEAFKASNISVSQFQGMAELDLLYNRMTAAGRNSVDVEKEITARMAMIFPTENAEKIKQRTNVYFTEKLHGATSNLSKVGLGNEVQKTIDAINKEEERAKYGNRHSNEDKKVDKYADNVANMYIDEESSLDDNQKAELKNLAKSLYILKQRSGGNYSQKEILEALNEIRTHADDNEYARQLVDDLYDEDLDIDTLSHVVSKNILKQRTSDKERLDKFINSLDETYEEEYANMSEDEKEKFEEFATDMFILSHRNVGGYSSEEVMQALERVNAHANDNEQNKNLVDSLAYEDSKEFTLEEYSKMITEECADNPITEEEQNSVEELAKNIVNEYEENPREGFYDDELSSHEIIKDMDNEAEMNKMIDSVFEARKNAVSEAGSQIALDILTRREVNILENHLDTETKTYDGYTKDELYAQEIMAWNALLEDLNPFNKGGESSTSLLDHYAIHFLQKSENDRANTYKKINEERDFFTSANEYIEARKKAREKIANDHFMGDPVEKKKK